MLIALVPILISCRFSTSFISAILVNSCLSILESIVFTSSRMDLLLISKLFKNSNNSCNSCNSGS